MDYNNGSWPGRYGQSTRGPVLQGRQARMPDQRISPTPANRMRDQQITPVGYNRPQFGARPTVTPEMRSNPITKQPNQSITPIAPQFGPPNQSITPFPPQFGARPQFQDFGALAQSLQQYLGGGNIMQNSFFRR